MATGAGIGVGATAGVAVLVALLALIVRKQLRPRESGYTGRVSNPKVKGGVELHAQSVTPELGGEARSRW